MALAKATAGAAEFDTVGHAINCPHVSTHPSLSVLPIVDHTDEGVAELIQQLTMAEVQVLVAAGADRRADGSIEGVSLTPMNTSRSSLRQVAKELALRIIQS